MNAISGATCFFRDPEAFAVFAKKAVPFLLAEKGTGLIRVWIPGCSTGEEAYSVAMLLQEQIEASRQPSRLQILGTDIDGAAIAQARQGCYPLGHLATDLAPERLHRFFSVDGQTGHINECLRGQVAFAVQDLLADPPPGSGFDLICCRNLLVHLPRSSRPPLFRQFHAALKHGGILFLGPAETPGAPALFTPLDRAARLYRRA